MAKYDGLIIPRSYSEYINKTDAATHQQAHQVSGVLDDTPTENSSKAIKSGGVYSALAGKQPTLTFDDVPTEDSDNPVKSGGIFTTIENAKNNIDTLNIDTEKTDVNVCIPGENKTQIYSLLSTAANVPDNTKNFFVMTIKNDTAITQIAIAQDAAATGNNHVYIRHGTIAQNATSWSAWENYANDYISVEPTISGTYRGISDFHDGNLQIAHVKNNVLYINLCFIFTGSTTISNSAVFLRTNKVTTKNTLLMAYIDQVPKFCYLRADSSSYTGLSDIVIMGGGTSVANGSELDIIGTIPCM